MATIINTRKYFADEDIIVLGIVGKRAIWYRDEILFETNIARIGDKIYYDCDTAEEFRKLLKENEGA